MKTERIGGSGWLTILILPDGVWFVFPTKSSSEKSIVYNDAVEEALCFGWIDSTIKSLDKEHKIQRFTPRNPKSTYSQANKEKVEMVAGA